jgi:uncharacterized RDD family membrane protein YckC
MMASKNKIAIRRFLAFGIDWLVIAIWAGTIFGIVMLSFSGQPPGPSGPWRSQAVGFLAMTLPIIFYFSLCEASSWQATLGKRILSLRVVDNDSDRTPFTRILLRNIVKFAPWELGHMVANQAIFSSAGSLPAWVYVPMVFAFALPLWWILSIYFQGSSPYDLITSTRIVSEKEFA